MGETRVVKRYANRKLYDTQRSRYVTLEQIAEMIRGGEDVKIVDNNSKEDLTAITLTQIIFEEEKKQSFLPLSALRNIIQSGANNMTQFATQAGERVRGIFKRIRSTVESLSPLSSIEKEMRALTQRLADLEKRLEERD
jgi:polyhydroxyalkanoate synthesis repressor PhaR